MKSDPVKNIRQTSWRKDASVTFLRSSTLDHAFPQVQAMQQNPTFLLTLLIN